MNVIYEPKGRAKEYSELACNLYMGCTHGCRYCFAPACMHKKPEEWHGSVTPRRDVITLFEKDAAKLQGDSRPILFSFLSDPYQPLEAELHLTRQALEIVRHYQLKSKILTKGSANLIRADFGLMKAAGTELGITVSFVDEASRRYWEPAAAPLEDRFGVLRDAHTVGIFTWVSLEPVIDPGQALEVIRRASPYVDLWKIGKINHNKAVEDSVDWHQFYRDVVALLRELGAKAYIKEDLKKFAGSR